MTILGVGPRTGDLATALPYLSVDLVAVAAGAVFAELEPLGIVPPVLVGGIVSLPAVGASQGNYLSRSRALFGHRLVQ